MVVGTRVVACRDTLEHLESATSAASHGGNAPIADALPPVCISPYPGVLALSTPIPPTPIPQSRNVQGLYGPWCDCQPCKHRALAQWAGAT